MLSLESQRLAALVEPEIFNQHSERAFFNTIGKERTRSFSSNVDELTLFESMLNIPYRAKV